MAPGVLLGLEGVLLVLLLLPLLLLVLAEGEEEDEGLLTAWPSSLYVCMSVSSSCMSSCSTCCWEAFWACACGVHHVWARIRHGLAHGQAVLHVYASYASCKSCVISMTSQK